MFCNMMQSYDYEDSSMVLWVIVKTLTAYIPVVYDYIDLNNGICTPSLKR